MVICTVDSLANMSVRRGKPDDLVRVLALDNSRDVEELKLMAAELGNDKGGSVFWPRLTLVT